MCRNPTKRAAGLKLSNWDTTRRVSSTFCRINKCAPVQPACSCMQETRDNRWRLHIGVRIRGGVAPSSISSELSDARVASRRPSSPHSPRVAHYPGGSSRPHLSDERPVKRESSTKVYREEWHFDRGVRNLLKKGEEKDILRKKRSLEISFHLE